MIKTILIGSLTGLVPLSIYYFFDRYNEAGLEGVASALGNILCVMLFFGLVYAILIKYVSPFLVGYEYSLYMLGGFAGLIYSLFGRYYYRLPEEHFGFGEYSWIVHVLSIMYWSVIYGYGIDKLNEIIC